MVICRRNLNDICAYDVEIDETAQCEEQLTARDPAGLWRARARRVGWVEHVDIDRDVDRGIADAAADSFDSTRNADRFEVFAGNDLKAEHAVLRQVFGRE